MLKTFTLLFTLLSTSFAMAGGGDPQIKTNHPWYPGELSCSTFERLFETQQNLYQRETGKSVKTDQDKAIASWYWRNLNFAHGEEGKPDTFGKGFRSGTWNRGYWAGLFGYGFGLCGTTHSQYTVEMNRLLGHCRGRSLGVTGHNSFEVFLKGDAYGNGRWALLDHDISTIIFDKSGTRLLGIHEIQAELKTFQNPQFKPTRQQGWLVAGLHPQDASAYSSYRTAEPLSGYEDLPPMIHLRSGETITRYLKPGLKDEKTFVYWGRNYNAKGVPGPERSRSWVNQPEKMYQSKKGTGWVQGQVRFANAVYTYQPFDSKNYREGVASEGENHVTFEFYSPYIIATTPANNSAWGIYDAGGKNGLVLSGDFNCPVKISTDQGQTWQEKKGATDLTDFVKGHQQYFIKFMTSATKLENSHLTMRTVCQVNVATIPRLVSGQNNIEYHCSNQGVISAGPNNDQAEPHVIAGAINSKTVTLELTTPRKEKATAIYVSARIASGSPPKTNIKYQVEYSIDGGKNWKPIIKNWQLQRHGHEPKDFWSQSYLYGHIDLKENVDSVQVRYTNDGGKRFMVVNAHLIYQIANPTPVEVTFAWTENKRKTKTAAHSYQALSPKSNKSWRFSTQGKVETKWVKYRAQ